MVGKGGPIYRVMTDKRLIRRAHACGVAVRVGTAGQRRVPAAKCLGLLAPPYPSLASSTALSDTRDQAAVRARNPE